MRRFEAGGVDLRDRLRSAASRRNAMDRPEGPGSEEDHPVSTPAASPAVRSGADRDRRTPGDFDLSQLPEAEKRHGAPVRRPERKRAVLRPGQRARRKGIKRTQPELPSPVGPAGAEDQMASVGRDLHRAAAGRPGRLEVGLLRRKDGKPNGTNGSRGSAPGAEPGRGGDREGQRRNAPGHELARLARLDARRGSCGRLGPAPRDPLELQPDVVGRLPAGLRLLHQTNSDDSIQGRRAHRLDLRDRLRLGGHDGRDERRLARARERFLPGRHLVENRPEREDVRPRVGVLAFELFRRHVLERPQDRPFLRQVGLRGKGREAPGRRHRRKSLGQPEVEQLQTRARHHHVGRLQVTVHDPLPVSLFQRVGNLDSVAQHLLDRQSPAGRQAVGQRLSFQVLHDEVLRPVLVPDVVQRADVRVRELRDRLRFTLEALAHLGRSAVRRENLDRDRAIEPRVAGPVHLPHPPGADRREDLVGPEAEARRERHAVRSDSSGYSGS